MSCMSIYRINLVLCQCLHNMCAWKGGIFKPKMPCPCPFDQGSKLCEHSLGPGSTWGCGFPAVCEGHCTACVQVRKRMGRAKSVNLCLGLGRAGSKDIFVAFVESFDLGFGPASWVFIWKSVRFFMDLRLAGGSKPSHSFVGNCDQWARWEFVNWAFELNITCLFSDLAEIFQANYINKLILKYNLYINI